MTSVTITINGEQNIPVYLLDSNNSLQNRIAATLNTLPTYLFFPDYPQGELLSIKELYKKKVGKTIPLHVIDVLELIKEDSETSNDLEKFLDKDMMKVILKNKNEYYVLQKIIPVWLSYKPNLFLQHYQSKPKYAQMMLDAIFLSYSTQLSKYYSEETAIKVLNKVPKTKEQLKFDIQYIKKINRDTEENQSVLEKTEQSETTDFIPDKYKYSYNIQLEDVTILEFFNYIRLNENIPFATCKNFYKILQDFIPDINWTNATDQLIMKVLQKKIWGKKIKYDDYSDIVVTYNNTTDNLLAIFDLIINPQNINSEEYITRFLSIFEEQHKVKLNNKEDIEIAGVFYVKNININIYVLLDLIMNDSIFSQLLFVDESKKASKIKSNTHIHFNAVVLGHITVDITTQQISDNPPRYDLRVKVNKAKNMYDVKIFKNIFSKLITLYKQKEQEIIDIYQEYIPSFGRKKKVSKEVIDKEGISLKKELPKLFIENFTRHGCDKPPTMIREGQVDAIKVTGKKVMEFPKEGDDKRHYYCNYEKYPFPGVKVNEKLPNKEMYPYIPCCFNTDPSSGGKTSKLYDHYFYDTPLEITSKIQQKIISTGKLLERHITGKLPPILENYFSILTVDTKYTYIRKGVSRLKESRSSFLAAIMEALDDNKIYELQDNKELGKYLNKTRNTLANNITNLPLCKQELYDNTLEEIQNNIKNPEMDLDSKLYIHLLEENFNCNIFIFNDTGMILPRHTQAYYKYITDRPNVLIYQHIGMESDISKMDDIYPQCELIIRTLKSDEIFNYKKRDKYQLSYDSGDEVSRYIHNTYNELSKTYVLNKMIINLVNPVEHDDFIPNSQSIDTYGKCRRINYIFDFEEITIFTEPLPTLKVPVISINENIQYITIKTVMKILEELDISPLYQVIKDGYIKEISAISSNTLISFPVKDEENKLSDIPIKESGLSYIEEDKKASVLDLYSRNKKIARYLVEYVYWFYSTYMYSINENENYTMDDKSILNFIETHTRVDLKFNYNLDNIGKKFTLESGFFKDKKLIFNSNEMLKRVVYILRVAILRNFLHQYRTQKVIKNYYVDLTDFTYIHSQVILQGEYSIDKWLEEKNIIYKLHKKIYPGITTPYFIEFKGQIYLAQNTDSMGKATHIAEIWYLKHYNIGIYAVDKDIKIQFILHDYYDLDTGTFVKKYGKGIKKPYSDTQIIKYKLGEDIFYTVLLSLGKN